MGNAQLQMHETNQKIVTMTFTDSNKTLLVPPLDTPVYMPSFDICCPAPVPSLTRTTKEVPCSFKCLMSGVLLLRSTLSFRADHNHK